LEDRVTKPNKWGKVGNKVYKSFNVTHDTLPASSYVVMWDQRFEEPIFVEKDIKTDAIMRFKGDLLSKLAAEVRDFWDKGPNFKANGFLHRRGYMLYGTQGTGKSSIVGQIAQDVLKNKGVVFICDNPRYFVKGLAMFREVEPNRPVVCVFEDIDAIIDRYGESELLSLLDGDSQVDKVVNIATTNYPERLDKRIVSRPRRFDRLIKVEVPADEVRKAFLKAKLPKGQVFDKWFKLTKGLSFAGLSECLISVLCLGNDLDETVSVLKEIEERTPQLAEFGGKIGFDTGRDDSTPVKSK
jgi:SpoVK/Ycf46/Vps4 family AAA+-type ATPase